MGSCKTLAVAVITCLWLAVGSQAARPLGASLGSGLHATAGKPFTGEVWALLIAGSAGYGNYRHQADVAHAYQVLKKGGVPDDHIVVMMYDDVANDISNPHKGKLFNRPGGPDVYAGMPRDYTGNAVNADVFLQVLLGGKDAPTVLGSTGKVVNSTADDRVFVYYADHGAPGILGMPSSSPLYADQLLNTIRNKSAAGGFAEMVLYVEACESGSMFQGLLDDSLPIYAVTAANAFESSWGAYCPGQDPSPPLEFATCLGDLFSISFLEDDDEEDLINETMETQFEIVKRRTSQNGTYISGSHVLQFGDLAIDVEPVGDYQGEAGSDMLSPVAGNPVGREAAALPAGRLVGAIPQREADLVPLRVAVQRATTSQAKEAAEAALHAAVEGRRRLDMAVRATVAGLLQQPSILQLFQVHLGAEWAVPTPEAHELLVAAPLPGRSAEAPLVDDWDCLRAAFRGWEASCGTLDQYGMQYSRVWANLCNAGVSPAQLQAQAAVTCGASGVV
mmetsp:Transcript_14739/g.44517  ORF Transcript_14739/g.44517 Transcript_14739/m.44517 type:complete len:505 (-) Transcript_14739:2015-3529(-)